LIGVAFRKDSRAMTSTAAATERPVGRAKRSMYCGEPRAEHIGQRLVLKGWINSRRDHGGLVFVDLRDREGRCQIVLDPDVLGDRFAEAHRLRDEWVVAVRGKLRARPEGSDNENISTGAVELLAEEFEVLAESDTPPFPLAETATTESGEELRLRYRFLDLRRKRMQDILRMRSKVAGIVRQYFLKNGFVEVETPTMTRATPEGARDFLVPSRLNKGTFYALPQSPQLFKQLMMVAGYDRYFQIARCYRDEDLRGNRQPEFTQIDVEMSFIEPEDIYEVVEGLWVEILRDVKGLEIPRPFPRISHAEAARRYGSDKPDLRFGVEIRDLTDILAKDCDFQAFRTVLDGGGVVRAINVPGAGEKVSNTALRPGQGVYPKLVERFGGKGLAFLKAEADGKLASSIAKFFSETALNNIRQRCEAKPGDLILIVAGPEAQVSNILGRLRLQVAKDFDLIEKDAWRFTWVTDFPLAEWNPEEKRWDPAHHPFTAPHPDDIHCLDSGEMGKARSLAYDLALNGEEVAGGSIRINRRDLQSKIFQCIGIGPEEAQEKFGFLLNAFRYGAPPHGGIAFGLDRMIMLLAGTDSIRDVIAFPKTAAGSCLMTEAPAPVDKKQLDEVGIKVLPRLEDARKEEAGASAGS
jgi:aspartyl-tRNA synthetase